MAKRFRRRLKAKAQGSAVLPAGGDTAQAVKPLQQRRGLRMRINADGGMDIHHLMKDGAILMPGLVELKDSDGPVWIQVAKAGSYVKKVKDRLVRFELNNQVFDEIVRNFNTTINREIPIDFEHATEADVTDGSIAVTGAPAVGWIKALENRGDTLWGLVEWLPETRELIRTKKYKYFSPAIRFGAYDKHTGDPIGARMTSGGLTNNPFLDGMLPIAARDFSDEPLTDQEAKDGAVQLNWIESPCAPRMNLDVNVLQAIEGIRDIISAILPAEEAYEDDEEEEDEAPPPPAVVATPTFTAAQQCAAEPPTPAATLADKEPVIVMAEDTILLKEHNAQIGELRLTLKDVESKLLASDARVTELVATVAQRDSEIKALKDADTVRLKEERAKRVTLAFEQHRDSKKLTDDDREAMAVLLDNKPELFEKLYPLVDARTQVLSARISTERPAQTLPEGVARPDIKTLVAKYQDEGKLYDEAFTLAMRDLEPKRTS